MRVGFAGAGAIAEHHLGVLAAQSGVEITAVCDVDEGRAAAIARRAGARAFTDWDAMLVAADIDALFVCTPPMHHAAPALAALERGLAVYLEKPLARSLPDGEAIAAAWRASGAVCAVGYQWRSLDVLGELRRLLRGARPGMLVSRSYGPTEAARRDLEGLGSAHLGPDPKWADPAFSSGAWFADPRASGGILFELASHDVDLQIALAGPVESVQATSGSGLLALAGHSPSVLDDAVALLLRFAGGGLGAVHVAWNPAQRPPLYALDVHAPDVALQLALDPDFILRGRAHGAEVAVTGAVGPRTSSVVQFLAAARSGEPASVACSPGDALLTLRSVLACERALATGQCVAV